MLDLRKKRFLSTEFVAEENGAVVAELDRSIWCEEGEITVQGRKLHLRRHGGVFTLFDGDVPKVEVTQPSTCDCRYLFRFNNQEFELTDASWYSQTFLVRTGGTTIGSVRHRRIFAAGALIDLPDSLPLELRVFIGWIAMVQWDEDAAAGAAASVGA